jgi:hypothetical protein
MSYIDSRLSVRFEFPQQWISDWEEYLSLVVFLFVHPTPHYWIVK